MQYTRTLVLIIAALALVSASACGMGEENYGLPTLAPAKDQAAQESKHSTLERQAEGMGVKKLENGHLLVQGDDPSLRFSRIVTYLNLQSKENGAFDKLSGYYGSSTGDNEDYGDSANFKAQFSFDDFNAQTDLAQVARDLNVEIASNGYVTATGKTCYEKLNAVLAYNNAKAAMSGRDYKIKAWCETKEVSEKFASDRVDIVIHFSFSEPFERYRGGISLSTRITSYSNERRNAIIASAAVEFSQVLAKPEELTIVALDFAGDREHGPDFAYVFDAKTVGTLKEIYQGEKKFDANEILALAEIKERALRASVPAKQTHRSKEPVGEREAKIIAYIAVETARVIRPTKLLIVVHDFTGASPNQLTTWVYIFDRAAVESLRTEDLEPDAVLKKAQVAEQIGVIPGNRTVPPVKRIIPQVAPVSPK